MNKTVLGCVVSCLLASYPAHGNELDLQFGAGPSPEKAAGSAGFPDSGWQDSTQTGSFKLNNPGQGYSGAGAAQREGLKLATSGDGGVSASAQIASEPKAEPSLASAWFARSDAAKESQPHWMTPVITVTPRLEQEYRYDQLWLNKSSGASATNYGLNKGLELIPSANSEIIIGQPGYIDQSNYNSKARALAWQQGWADESFLFKYRMVSANEENGNYIVTGFMGVSVPTGDSPLSSGHYALTPTLAVGKGWGDRESGFDIQSTLAITIPDRNMGQLGEPIVWNTAFQGHLMHYWWPELETQVIHNAGGPFSGKNQIVLGPGLILGRYELIDRLKFVIGLSYQKALGDFQPFNNGWQMTARTPF